MAMSLSNFLYAIAAFFHFFITANAATVTYDFNVTWVRANPDAQFERDVIGINNQWPLPPVTATVGDRLIVNVENQLGNEPVTIHWHGMYMNGTTDMDGAAGVSQCEIPPGGAFTYNFTIDQPGTYWYHSHVRGQYPDGLRGPLIIHDPDSPFADHYDEEIVLTLSDWYHDSMPNLLSSFISVTNPTGAEPVPQAALMNDTQNLTVSVEPGKTYMFRMVNMGAFAAQYVWFEGHTMQIVEVDGIYTEPADAEMLYITAAQRYSVLVTMKNDTSANFAINGAMDQDLFDAVPDGLQSNVTGWLVYDQANENPAPTLVDEYNWFDDFTLVPQDGEDLYDNVDYTVSLDLKMDNLGDGANYAFFNDITYVGPKVPTLYTALTTGDSATDAVVYGGNTNPFILEHNQVVEIILNNNDPGKHPFHLHGHAFQLAYRSDEEAGPYVGNATADYPAKPMRRDTVLVKPDGHIVLRFKSDNPGIWLFHCHIEWHVASGLIATMVEAPLLLQNSLSIPPSHYDTCRASNTPFEGNAAGNTVDFTDLTGENTSPAPLPAGFTAGGIVALVFSCLAAFLGMAVIGWYGIKPIGEAEMGSAERRVREAGVVEETRREVPK
ncbi:multicopper oxidase [Aulographum hederae CBS 113979]|uniref:Multicopper oxidase n=1 Tax=Aulographum hederae CBS 113979 TaxID=1176131 RepID=A0A6G1GSM4_9PEZI|nr:multicopper oxidase [Aulographum hederae CBS 113979]